MSRIPDPTADEFAKFLFSLSSADRLGLLDALQVKPQRLTPLSSAISATPQETSKHIERLVAAGLAERDPAGAYRLTSFGRSILQLLPAAKFLMRYRPYFVAHDLSFLPGAYQERIGELSDGAFADHAGQVVETIRTAISGAREYAWVLSDQPIVVGAAPGKAFASPDLEVRLITEPAVNRRLVSDARSALPRAEFGILPRVSIALLVNEHFAGVCFPGLQGKIDFGAGFSGGGERFRSWCGDLFEHYWSQARRT